MAAQGCTASYPLHVASVQPQLAQLEWDAHFHFPMSNADWRWTGQHVAKQRAHGFDRDSGLELPLWLNECELLSTGRTNGK